MNLFKFINIPVFLLSLAFGIFAVYITIPKNRKILVYPTPENVGQVQYKDDADNCFLYTATEVKCPSDPGMIKTVPIQTKS